MQLKGNTILITGGGSGIGLGLANAFQKLGNEVIIAGRSQKTLDAALSVNSALRALPLDIENPSGVLEFASRISSEYPKVNVLINNAGISRGEKLLEQPADLSDMTAMVTTNLLGPIRLTAALLPHLLKQSNPVIMNNSSGLAFVPLTMAPTYCATKAALHSYTQSLRHQLKSSNIQVIELIPPYVQTTLSGEHQATDARAMPLDAFIAEVMQILSGQPDAEEVCVQSVRLLRDAARGGDEQYRKTFDTLNQMAISAAE